MPRPTPAQFVYGSATVVLSTFAMLLLSQTRSGLGVGVVTVVGLASGLLVALTVPVARVSRTSRTSRTVRTSRPMTGSERAHTRAHADSIHG
ncbi:hypothetical protein [Streptomyces malaysiensis]|uniref:hypothetical protein n=1 Tax=Streptomyces malaysiensis TaxID=92644 RepID=UPI003717B29A